MKRRDFLKTSAAAAGLAGALTMEPMLGCGRKSIPKTGSAAGGQSSG